MNIKGNLCKRKLIITEAVSGSSQYLNRNVFVQVDKLEGEC